MASTSNTEEKLLKYAVNIFTHIGETLDAKISVKLWNGLVVPLGKDVAPGYYLSIDNTGVLGSLLRKPTPENLLRLYVARQIDFHGGDLIDFIETARNNSSKKKLKGLKKFYLLKNLLPFIFVKADALKLSRGYNKDETGRIQKKRDNKEFIQFHYDVSNEFYKLFLDPEMQYSCAYFTSKTNSLEQAQRDKLEMICRKLRLKEGEKLLDIGCGWGGLICYAALNYGVSAHGVTLSQTQLDFAKEKIRKLGLENKVTVELCDYMKVEGQFDKISSIGMFEHIGLANFPAYFGKIRSLLRDQGILLNHGIASKAKKSSKAMRRIRPEKRLILKYIFPGTELDDIGHTVTSMEQSGFEVHDVEAWRPHYALTCKSWCKRLSAKQDEAIAQVGEEVYRLWIAYLAGVAFGFETGSLRINQTVASKPKKGFYALPLTREDLYQAPKSVIQKNIAA